MNSTNTLVIANSYGNVDVEYGTPKGYRHVPGERLQPLCRKLGIKYAQALIGWGGTKRYPRPIFDGVVVSARSAQKLLDAIEARVARNPPEKRNQAAQRRRERRAELLREAGLQDGTNTARWFIRGEVDKYEAQLIAWKAEYRHCFTNYDKIIRTNGRDDARAFANDVPIPDTWGLYLMRYGFDGDIARAMANTLRDPQKCHPIWFMEAKLALQRLIDQGKVIELSTLTYEQIRDAIDGWRWERDFRDG